MKYRRGDIREEELNGAYLDWDMVEEKGYNSIIHQTYYGYKRGGKWERYWKGRCLKRDRYTCVLCGATQDLQVHHLLRWYDKPTARYLLENGATLCRPCHEHGHGPDGADFAQSLTMTIVKILAERGQKFTKRCPELLRLVDARTPPRQMIRLIKKKLS